MPAKIYVVTDLGSGDGGKGGVVHKIATMTRAHTVVKVGGAQGSHGVCTSRGERFAFSQWGCATFEGIKTHISSRMIVSPEGLLNEADALKYGHGVHNAFDLLTVDESALCSTHYHGIASRLKELSRGKNPRGTVGTGVGEAYRYAEKIPELSIRVRDLSRPDIKDLLADVRQQILRDLDPIINGEFLPDDREEAAKEIALLNDDSFLDFVAKRFQEASRLAKIVDHDYLKKEVLDKEGSVVVESSHGILTDHYYGFYPHTSAIRTLPCFTRAMLRDLCFGGEVVNIGVFRAYAIRHGAGPLPTADASQVENLLQGSHKENNRYQGEVRVGPLDLILLRYAIEVCGGPSAFNGLAVTWFDQILANGKWDICDRYTGADDSALFTQSGLIKVRRGEINGEHLAYQAGLTKQLFSCRPETVSIDMSFADKNHLYDLCTEIIGKSLGVPIRMVSFGPTELDKICK